MDLRRRSLFALVAAGALIAGCVAPPRAADPVARAALAPTGTLRVGVYAGSPTSLVKDARTGESAGVAVDLGRALGAELGVPVQVVEFNRVAQVIDALRSGSVDFTFTNMSEARQREVDFSQPLVQLELGYLVPRGSRLQKADEIDTAGMRVGVSEGSTSQGVLKARFRQAQVVSAASIAQAQDLLRQGKLDAFATNKGVLFEMSDALPGARVLEGRWGVETLGMAIPKGRDSGMPFLREFGQRARSGGVLDAAIRRAGLRGTARAE